MIVHTAEGSAELDALEIGGRQPEGLPFAPDDRYRRWVMSLVSELIQKPVAERAGFQAMLQIMVAARYRHAMKRSEVEHPAAWQALRRREHVILCCSCHAGKLCHRYVLAALLEETGAHYRGEIG